MKRIVKSLIILLLVIVTSPVMAKEYTITDTDIKITLEDSWYVFTRDNIKDNKQLKEFGITEEYMNSTMEKGYIYLDSIKFKSNDELIELFVMKKPVEEVKNMSKYTDKELLEVAKEIAEQEKTTDYRIHKTDYKYIYTKYSDSGKEIIDYYTVVNGYGYTIKLQTDTKFTTAEETELKNIIKKVSFNVDKSLKEPSKGMSPLLRDVIIGAVVGGLAGAIGSAVGKKNKTNNQ